MKKYLYHIDTGAQDAPAKILRAVGRGKRVLEVGCASGTQTRVLKEELGCTVTGIEIDAAAAADAAQFCERVIVGDLETLDLASELHAQKFDVITIADVLEHLRNPLPVLVKLRAHLAPDAILLASIPNVVHAGLILEMAHGRFDYRPFGLLDDTHIRFFTLKSVYRLFEDAGFVVNDLDRVVRAVEETEMLTHSLSPEEVALIDFIKRNNAEAHTYQFIIAATAKELGVEPLNFAQLDALERLKNAELTSSALSRRVRSLEGQLSWIESRAWYQALSRLRRLFSRNGREPTTSPLR